MKKLLLIAVIISATAFGAEATTAAVPATTATGVAATCPMTGGAPMGTGKMMNQGQGNGTGQMSCNMMKGGKMGGMMGQMMNSLSEKDKATVTKNRTEIHTLMAEKEPNWKKIQKLHDENALIMSKGKVEMMKKYHPNMMNGTMNPQDMMNMNDGTMNHTNMNDGTIDHSKMNHQNMPVTPVKQN